ncbi:hypothetical protein DyAD56_14630 [Dyella sp. AD56]|nr:hypothetical protein DyAD56_14630 [Dyella sp. AD56]
MSASMLARLTGDWQGEETIATTRWGQGGPPWDISRRAWH